VKFTTTQLNAVLEIIRGAWFVTPRRREAVGALLQSRAEMFRFLMESATSTQLGQVVEALLDAQDEILALNDSCTEACQRLGNSEGERGKLAQLVRAREAELGYLEQKRRDAHANWDTWHTRCTLTEIERDRLKAENSRLKALADELSEHNGIFRKRLDLVGQALNYVLDKQEEVAA
jgi:chromosome segregation ATPase